MEHLPLLQSRVIKHHTSSLTCSAPDTKLRTDGRYRIRTTATLCRLMALNRPCTVRIAATEFKCGISVGMWTRQLIFTGWWWWWRRCMAHWCTSWCDGWSPGPRAAHGYYFNCIQKESKPVQLHYFLWNVVVLYRGIWLTCLHPRCIPTETTLWFNWEVAIVQFITRNWVHGSTCKQNNCNLPNESSHDLNWVATRI